jgi:hypothetical protein
MRKPPSSTFGGATCVEHEIEQRRHALIGGAFRRVAHPALLGRAVEDREVELLVSGVERGEEIEHFVDDFVGAGVGLVDLVDADDGLQADLQRLADDEFRLRHRAFGGVDEHDGAVDHGEDALHLAAEIGVAGRVDDVDARHPSRRIEVALARMVMPRSFSRSLESITRSATRWFSRKAPDCLQQLVDQRRLAVVDVGDDGDVAQLHGVFRSGAGSRQSSRGPVAGARRPD